MPPLGSLSSEPELECRPESSKVGSQCRNIRTGFREESYIAVSALAVCWKCGINRVIGESPCQDTMICFSVRLRFES